MVHWGWSFVEEWLNGKLPLTKSDNPKNATRNRKEELSTSRDWLDDSRHPIPAPLSTPFERGKAGKRLVAAIGALMGWAGGLSAVV